MSITSYNRYEFPVRLSVASLKCFHLMMMRSFSGIPISERKKFSFKIKIKKDKEQTFFECFRELENWIKTNKAWKDSEYVAINYELTYYDREANTVVIKQANMVFGNDGVNSSMVKSTDEEWIKEVDSKIKMNMYQNRITNIVGYTRELAKYVMMGSFIIFALSLFPINSVNMAILVGIMIWSFIALCIPNNNRFLKKYTQNKFDF